VDVIPHDEPAKVPLVSRNPKRVRMDWSSTLRKQADGPGDTKCRSDCNDRSDSKSAVDAGAHATMARLSSPRELYQHPRVSQATNRNRLPRRRLDLSADPPEAAIWERHAYIHVEETAFAPDDQDIVFVVLQFPRAVSIISGKPHDRSAGGILCHNHLWGLLCVR
jgi:hypothetical protein